MKRGVVLLVVGLLLFSPAVSAFSFGDFFSDIGESIGNFFTGFSVLMFEEKGESKGDSSSKSSPSKSSPSKASSSSSSSSGGYEGVSSSSSDKAEEKAEKAAEEAAKAAEEAAEKAEEEAAKKEKDVEDIVEETGVSKEDAEQLLKSSKTLEEAIEKGDKVKLENEINIIEESEGSEFSLEIIKLDENRREEILRKVEEGEIEIEVETVNSIKYKTEKNELIVEAQSLVEEEVEIVVNGNIFSFDGEWKEKGIFGDSEVGAEYEATLDELLLNKKILDGEIPSDLSKIDLLTNTDMIKPVGFFKGFFLGIFFDDIETCDDGVQNQDEDATDCGGSCGSCMECNAEDIVNFMFNSREEGVSALDIQEDLEGMLPGCSLEKEIEIVSLPDIVLDNGTNSTDNQTGGDGESNSTSIPINNGTNFTSNGTISNGTDFTNNNTEFNNTNSTTPGGGAGSGSNQTNSS